MSRVAKSPISIPSGVEIKVDGQKVSVKGGKGTLEFNLSDMVSITVDGGVAQIASANDARQSVAMAGTSRALISNMVTGVTTGWSKKLEINGVGYRAQVQGSKLNLTLGHSHPINYDVPQGISIECPSQTEIVISGVDKQQVGQVASEIRAFRGPEPYKGKGVKYADEHIVRKEAKKS